MIGSRKNIEVEVREKSQMIMIFGQNKWSVFYQNLIGLPLVYIIIILKLTKK
jgi:hypothetical protein